MHAGDDPAIVTAPWGDEVDGRRLLHEAVGFGRALRAAGLQSTWERPWTTRGPCPWSTWASASRSARPARPSSSGGATTGEIYDAVFDRWWRQRRRRQGDFAAPPLQRPTDDRTSTARRPARPSRSPGEERVDASPDERGIPIPSAGDDDADDDADIEGVGRRAGRLLARRDAAPPRVRPDDARPSCATPSAWSTR